MIVVEDTLLQQQEALAKFGELVLRSDNLDEILTEVCRLAGKTLGTDLAKIMELQPDGVTLLVRAGVGWTPGVIGQTTMRADEDTPDAYALQTGQPVTSNDIDSEQRFRYADFVKDHGVKALVNVAIVARKRTLFGTLEVDSRAPRVFSDTEVSLLRGYANLLAAAVDRFDAAAERQNSEAALQARKAALSHSNKLETIGHLTGGVAHEFNNLLMVIRAALYFLRRPDLAADRHSRYTSSISNAVDRASMLTERLVAYAKRQTLQAEVFNVNQEVSSVVHLLNTLLGSRIQIKQQLSDSACFALADAGQFETALMNLAMNARDAMNGEGELVITVQPVTDIPPRHGGASRRGNFIAISFMDTGAGIDSDLIPQLFEPYFSTKEAGRGTGLGLSQVLSFAKQSNGDLAVHSALGQGSTFTLYLPESK